MATRILFTLLAIAFGGTAVAETKLIHAGFLLAVPGERVQREQTIVVVDDRIRELRSGYADPADFVGEVEVIDLREYFVMPGLMDMHVHLQGELGPRNDSEDLKMSPQQMQMRS
ncbi:MAG: hypothetical protein R3358_02960, partial [Woeseiaceae bacterium]|nr:hypothetical protein [Woeseiaceae bacterium]